MTAQLKRVRHGARAALTLGVVVSVVANILHAADNPISQSIAAWAPLALLIAIELIARVPVRRGVLSFARLVATATIAGIAAWVSYWHMVGVALRYGEEPGAAHLIPLTVDGLVVVAWVCLVEIGSRIRDVEKAGVAHPVAQQGIDERPLAVPSAPVFLAPVSAPPASSDEAPGGAAESDDSAGQRVRQDVRTAQQIEAVVRAMRASDPKMSQRQIAEAVVVPETTVRRILRRSPVVPDPAPASMSKVNGHVPVLVGAGRSEQEEG